MKLLLKKKLLNKQKVINMAKIFLKLAKTEPIYISNARARNLAIDKKKFENKEIENEWVDIDNFHGFLSDIRSIVFGDERVYNNQTTSYEAPTPEQIAYNKKKLAEIRKNLFGSNSQYKN